MNDKEILADWSDEEEYLKEGILLDGQTWTPKPQTVAKLYAEITQNKFVPLHWKPGARINPNPTDNSKVASTPGEEATSQFIEEAKALEYDDFDEETPAPQTLRKGTPKGQGSQKKKPVTTLEGILSNMVRHKIIDQQAVDEEVGVGGTGSGQSESASAPGSSPSPSVTGTENLLSQESQE